MLCKRLLYDTSFITITGVLQVIYKKNSDHLLAFLIFVVLSFWQKNGQSGIIYLQDMSKELVFL